MHMLYPQSAKMLSRFPIQEYYILFSHLQLILQELNDLYRRMRMKFGTVNDIVGSQVDLRI
jgi:hypothetical protein